MTAQMSTTAYLQFSSKMLYPTPQKIPYTTTLIAETKNDLIALMERVNLASEKAGLYLNVGKTKVMKTEDQGEMVVDGKHIEVVSHFIFLGYLITKDGFYEKEIRKRLAMGRSAMGGLTKIWKDKGITVSINIRLVKALKSYTEQNLVQ